MDSIKDDAQPKNNTNIKIAGLGVLIIALSINIFHQVMSPASSPALVNTYTCGRGVGYDPLAPSDSARATHALESLDRTNGQLKEQGASKKQNEAYQSILAERKNSALMLMRNDPDTAAQELFSTKERARSTPPASVNCTEEPVSDVGTISILHADYPGNEATFQYVFRGEKVKEATLHIPRDMMSSVVSETKVKVTGLKLDNEVLLDPQNGLELAEAPKSGGGAGKGGSGGGGTTPPSTTTVSVGTKPEKTLVVVATFQGGSKPSISKSTIDNIVFGQVSNYFYQTSYGIVSIPGASYVDVQFSIAPTCSIYLTMQEVVKALDAQVNFLDYQNIVVVSNFPCSWGGVSWIGKDSLYSTDGFMRVGQALINANMADKRVIGHELGHSLGAHHAGSLQCGSKPLPTDSSYGGCTMSEYGDPYEIMGLGYGEMNAPHRQGLGWFAPENVLHVTQNGTYRIEPLEVKSSGIKALTIPRSDPQMTYNDFWMEYRQPLGEDRGYNQNVYSGPIIHYPGGNKPMLVDVTPPSDMSTAALPPGKSFVDPISGTTVTTLSADNTGTTINVQFGKTDYTPPQINGVLPADGSTVSGIVPLTVDVSDASGISRVEWSVQNASTPFAVTTSEPWTAELDTTKFPNGNTYLIIKAYDNAGASYGVSNNVNSKSIMLVIAN